MLSYFDHIYDYILIYWQGMRLLLSFASAILQIKGAQLYNVFRYSYTIDILIINLSVVSLIKFLIFIVI